MLKLDPVEEWITVIDTDYSGSKGTKTIYLTAWKQFEEFTGVKAREIIEQWNNITSYVE